MRGQQCKQLIGDLFMQGLRQPPAGAERGGSGASDLSGARRPGGLASPSTDSYVIDPLFFPAAISASWPSAVPPTMRRSARHPALSFLRLYSRRGADGHRLNRSVARQHGSRHRPGGRDRHRHRRRTKWMMRGAADKLFINTARHRCHPGGRSLGTQQISAVVMCRCWSAARAGSWRHTHP